MQDLGVKKKILEEIMGMMDEKEGDKLKNHPKIIAMKAQIIKPKEDAPEMLKEKIMGDSSEMKKGHESAESPAMEKSEEELSPEMISKILEMMNEK